VTHARTALILALSALSIGVTACDGGSGSGQKAKGDVKEAVGSITGDKDLKRSGQKDQVVGGVKETVHDAKDAVKDATN
jgi:uncharacterized protein YjbJ (UPF0337 family)